MPSYGSISSGSGRFQAKEANYKGTGGFRSAHEKSGGASQDFKTLGSAKIIYPEWRRELVCSLYADTGDIEFASMT
jgi:hypothetical protein